ncbi:MAG: M24 family metallopeptidase [Arcobacteraceae bacterium]
MENYILKNENAIYYECGYSCDNAIYICLGKDSFFITDARYTIEAEHEVQKAQVIESKDLIKTAQKLIKDAKIKKIVFDGNDFTFEHYHKLTHTLKTKFVNEPHFSMLKRAIKTNKEIKYLTKASKLGRKGFNLLAKYIRKNGFNQTEKFLHFKAIEKLTQFGKYDVSFDPIVAINENSAKPHALPTSKKLEVNDLLLVDAGVKYKRYCSDRTCTAHVDFEHLHFKREQKFKNPKQQKIYDIVLKAHQTAINGAKSGMKAKEIDALARNVIKEAGYEHYFVHSTGHGVGLDIHEHPFINSKSDVIIEDNMVFTIEPGIYLPNEFGVRIEDTIVMQNGRAVIL